MTFLPHLLMWASGAFAGIGLCYTNTGTRTGNGIAGMAYIAAALIGGLGVMAEVGW